LLCRQAKLLCLQAKLDSNELRSLVGHSRSHVFAAGSNLLHKAGFQAHGDAVHFAGDFVVAITEADGLGF
jgi:hypothetical protein